ncbi:MAG: RluA family pseudouridine synthase [Isosphaeraceae bacterium]
MEINPSTPFLVLYEDAHCLAVAKPAGLATQGRSGPTLESAIRAYLSPEDPGGIFLGTVHRLDRPVSGAMLWAKTPKAARRLATQFAERSANKLYWALVQGRPLQDSGLWEDWLYEEDTGVGRVQICRPGTPRSRLARTRFAIVPLTPGVALPTGVTWLAFRPETGRTHQLRVQSSGRGMPVLGDRSYGSTDQFDDGIALHSRSIELDHPITGRPLMVEAAPPHAWPAFIRD